jgi:general stress protein 26
MTSQNQQHLYDLIKDFKVAMLVTHSSGGHVQARPMAIAELKEDADACFAASITSPKIAEIEKESRVLVTFQSGSEFATIDGTATVVRDRAEIDRLWSEAWRVWFPGGKDDPSLCLIKVNATSGEYWDNSGLQGLTFLFEGMKAIFQGTTPASDEKQHAKVSL